MQKGVRKRAKHAQRKSLSQQTWQTDHFQAPTLILDHTAGIRVAEATESPTEAEGGLRTGTHPTWACQGKSNELAPYPIQERERRMKPELLH